MHKSIHRLSYFASVCHCYEFLLCVLHIEFTFRTARYVCDSFLSISLEVSLASAWIGNDRADPWKANTQNIGYISLRCAFMLFEHEVANIEPFFKTRASAHTGGELLSTSLPVYVLVELLVESFFRMIARMFGKFPPRNVASGWGTLKTVIQTRWFSTRYCCSATSDLKTRCCLLSAWLLYFFGYSIYSWSWGPRQVICKLIYADIHHRLYYVDHSLTEIIIDKILHI